MLARLDIAEADRKPRPGSERLCAVTRAVTPVDEMIRFVAGADGTLVPDVKRKLPGRGVWVKAGRDIVAQAVRRGVFARALKTEVRVAPDLPDMVDRLLERAVLDALAIARKAGQTVAGFTKVERALASATVIGLVHAADAGPDGLRKIAAAAERRTDAPACAVIDCFSATHLDLAFGRPNVGHAALLAGPASEAVLARWRRLVRSRTGNVAA